VSIDETCGKFPGNGGAENKRFTRSGCGKKWKVSLESLIIGNIASHSFIQVIADQ
jgi:hypothetical protein